MDGSRVGDADPQRSLEMVIVQEFSLYLAIILEGGEPGATLLAGTTDVDFLQVLTLAVSRGTGGGATGFS